MEQRKCTICEETKFIEEFESNGRGRRRKRQCSRCRNATLPRVLSGLVRHARASSHKNGLSIDIDIEYVRKLWDDAGGRCAISGEPFSLEFSEKFNRANPYRPSLDRINPNRGYVKGNVRLVLWALNAGIADFGLEIYMKVAQAVLKNNPSGHVSCSSQEIPG